MNYKLFFLCFLFFRAYSDYTALQLFLLATNPDDAAALYANIKPDDLNKSRPGKAKAAQPAVQAAIAKKPAAGAAGCLTKAEAEAIVNFKLPDIANATAAKAALAEFFNAGNTGGKLLAEIAQNPAEADAVRTAIGKITPKA